MTEATDGDAIETKSGMGRNHGLLVGISSGANVGAARQLPPIWAVTLGSALPDRAERYFSAALM